MFSSFTNRDFRIYWIGMFVSLCGSWIQTMALSWLVFEISNSSFLLGLVGFVSTLPILLFSLFSGVLVDRIDRRKLLLFTQTIFMILAFLLAVFTQFKIVTVNFIMLISLLNGIIMSLDAPARQAMVVDLVGKTNILNAIAFNSIAFHLARMIGPALAGMFIAVISIAGCFYINAVSFLAFIIPLFIIRTKQLTNTTNTNNFFEDLKSGLKFIRVNPLYLKLISIVGAISLFGFSYMILMPVFAKVVLKLDVKGYGLLMSASGIGSVLGGLMLASLRNPNLQPKILFFSLYGFCISLMVFALSKSFIFSILLLTLTGFFVLVALANINSFIQSKVPDEFRGRVMSIYMLTFAGTFPFGSLFAGSLSSSLGVSFTLFLSGLVCLVLFLILTRKIQIKELVFA